eukprot:TRINITY_DN196_c0_g1_i1.p1 TRINITY_DN196_c0_g1~~TRINITY_DN196_c0_g1_i1.p1  ORF type:complete len:1163 (+),score=467.74 TRINITY_DN196_c0_g1_i1:39-3527(+)
MSSVEQVVGQIIETLSDGVSELVLMVVVLAEQNQAMPSTLPNTANQVNTTANKLSLIARKLADTDYKAFPSISKEILEASEQVESATKVMSNSVGNLSGSADRKKGWEGLVDACRVMSGKTIRLLQIVYGAPLKRLQLNIDNALDAVDNFKPPKDLRDANAQQKLLDDLKPITDAALRANKHLKDRAALADSPMAKQALEKAADDVLQKAQDLVNAVNRGIADNNNDFTKPLADLKDALERGKDLATRNAPPAPGPLGNNAGPRAGNLQEALDRAKESARQVPNVVQKNPRGVPDASNQVRDDVDEVRKRITPNPHAPYDWNKEIEVPLEQQYQAARNALKSPGNPEAKKKLDDATNDLIRALNDLGNKQKQPQNEQPMQQQRGNNNSGPSNRNNNAPATRGPQFEKPADPQTRKNIEEAVKGVTRPLDRAIAKPEDKERYDEQRLRDLLNGARDQAEQKHPKAVADRIRQAAPIAKQLADNLRENARNGNFTPEQRQQKIDAADALDRSIPNFVEKGKEAIKDLNQDKPVRDFQDSIHQMERALDRAAPSPMRPLSQEEWDDVKDNMNKARDAAKRGDRQALQKAMDALKDPMDRIRNFNVQPGTHSIPDPSKPDGPSDELKRLWDKFRNAANKNPNDLDKILPEMEKAWDKYNKETGSAPIAAADRLADAIDQVQNAVDTGDRNKYPTAGKNLQDRYNDFVDQVNNHPDPKVKAAGHKAAEALRPQLEELLGKAAQAISAPKDKSKQQAVDNLVPQMKKPLADFRDAASPQQNDYLVNDKHGAGVKDSIAKLKDALNEGNPDRVKKALDDVKKNLGQYNDQAHKLADKQADPGKRDYLNDRANDLDDLLKDLDNLRPSDPSDRIARQLDPVASLIDDFTDTLEHDAADNAIKANAKANNLLATLNSASDDDMDLGSLLDAAGEMADLMRGLVGNTSQAAHELGANEKDLSDAARAALDLDDILKGLESGSSGSDSSARVAQASSNVRGGSSSSSSNSPFDHAPAVPLSQARSFEDVAQAVAYNIHKQSEQFHSTTGNSVAVELANLASAARSGDKQKMLFSAKAASGHILAFAKELQEMAAKIPGKNQNERQVQDHLLRCAQGLRNYATHIKILTSVKAASIEQSKDTDESLTHLSTDLGDIISQALNSMGIVHSVILKR